MLLRVDMSRPMFRAMYSVLYDRLTKASLEFGDTEGIAAQRMQRLTGLDPLVHLLVDLDVDTGAISAHALVIFNQVGDSLYEPFVEQLVSDSGQAEEFTRACIAYVEGYPITQIVMMTAPNKARAFTRKYGFESYRLIMVRRPKGD